MTVLTDTAGVRRQCASLMQSIKADLDNVYAQRKSDEALKFSIGWDGVFPESAPVDLTMHSFGWKLLREKSAEELTDILVADCARALEMRRQMEAQMQTGSTLQ